MYVEDPTCREEAKQFLNSELVIREGVVLGLIVDRQSQLMA